MNNYLNCARRLMALLGAAAVACMLAVPASAADADPLAAYYDNTLVCQNQVTKAKCRLWLNRTGKFYVFYDLGSQPKKPDINGPFQINGREGTYTLRKDGAKYKLCLWPAAPRIYINAEQQREVFTDAGCNDFTPHKLNDSWTDKDLVGRDVKFWLMEGR